MIGSRRARLLLVLSLLVAAQTAVGQAPTFAIHVRSGAEAGRAVLVVEGLLRDRALLGAIESGLPLRFHLRVELWERGLFDRLERAEEHRMVLVQDPIDKDFRLEAGQVERRFARLAEAQAAVEAEMRPTLRAERSGRYYYLASLEIETLSLSDLEELRRWLRGEVRPAVEGRAPAGRAVERGLRRVFVRVIGLPTRHYEARSANFAIP